MFPLQLNSKKILLVFAASIVISAAHCQPVAESYRAKKMYVLTVLPSMDSSILVPSTAWVKRQLYAEKTANFTPGSVPYALSNGKLGEDPTGLMYDGNNLFVGHSGFSNTVGLYLNGNRGYMLASGFGVSIGTVGGTPTDPSKQIQFYNGSVRYFRLLQPGQPNPNPNDTLEMETDVHIYPSTTNRYYLGREDRQYKYGFLKNIWIDSFKMKTNPGAGKVLTSDADGNGTWQSASSSASIDAKIDSSRAKDLIDAAKFPLYAGANITLRDSTVSGVPGIAIYGAAGAGGSSTLQKFGEEFTGAAASTLTLLGTPVTATLSLLKNGLRLPSSKFSLSGSTVTLTDARISSDLFQADYVTSTGTGSANLKFGEEFTGSTTSTLTLANAAMSNTLRLTKNGVRLPVYQFSITGATVTLTSPRLTTDLFQADYNY